MAATRHDSRCSAVGFTPWWKTVPIFAAWLLVICCGAIAAGVPLNLAALGLTLTSSMEAKSIEYQLKAAFLYNFIKFVDWPEPSSAAGAEEAKKKDPIVLCVLGEDFFGRHLDDLTKKTVRDRQIRVVRLEGFEQYKKSRSRATLEQYFQEQRKALEGCHLLFISQSEEKPMNELAAFTDKMQILTVSDISGFAGKGGVIEFVMEENKIRFDINVVSAERKGLKISSQLLQLARKIYKKTP